MGIDGQSFPCKDELLAMVDKARVKVRKPGHHAGGAVAAHHQREAERIIRVMAARLDLILTNAPTKPSNISSFSAISCGFFLPRIVPEHILTGFRSHLHLYPR